ncbi:MAG: hypothetical protein DHS20C02_13610 [Micavibrio sp.]|nr:MAG: hypothetical protein DHS20C02_13610 [Micavibrio sp.]
MSTLLPLDSDNNPIPALRLKDSAAHSIAAAATSARNTTAFDDDTKVVSVFADVPVYINFGGSTVTATTSDHYFPAGVYYDISVGGGRTGHYTHLAVLRVSTDGSVYISEKE